MGSDYQNGSPNIFLYDKTEASRSQKYSSSSVMNYYVITGIAVRFIVVTTHDMKCKIPVKAINNNSLHSNHHHHVLAGNHSTNKHLHMLFSY